MKAFSDFILKKMGWKIKKEISDNIKKALVIVAPHSSYWDFVMGRLSFWHMRVDTKFFIKKEAFFWPAGDLLKKLGGIPVIRGKAGRLTNDIAKMFEETDSLFITITPEGTRDLVKKWKLGFYRIAMAASVPIVFGVLDYKNKTGGMKTLIYPTGDIEKDLREIQSFYKGIEGKNPELSNFFD